MVSAPLSRPWLVLAALDGAMAVMAGAFGAHGAHDPTTKELLRTGAQYQMVHAVAALACAPLASRTAGWSAGLFGTGGLLFGGSLYALAAGAPRITGVVTPLGGLLMIAGWLVLLFAAVTHRPASGR